jgi:pimeloyl-ACP methyl ester carboxylesterase
VLNYTIYENQSTQWVTFVHGAGELINMVQTSQDFKKRYNVLLLDLRMHNSKSKTAFKQNYTFSALANDILEVLDFLKIEKSHFVEFPWNTILIRQLAEMYPHRVESMILGGAILK